MDSDLSDILSDVGSETSDPRSEGEEDVAYNDDDEDYVEPPEDTQMNHKSSQRIKSKANSLSSNVTENNKVGKRQQVQSSSVDDEDMVRPKRRHIVLTETPADEEDLEEEGEAIDEDSDGIEAERDDVSGMEAQKDQSEELREEIQDAAGLEMSPEDEEGEDTTDSMKPTRSKMLLNLLGDGSSRKSLTEEEIQLRRAENARKRKNLSERRSEEEKQETINKLLRRRAGKSRSHIPNEDEENSGDATVFSKPRRPYDSSGMSRTIRKYSQDLFCIVEHSNNI